MRRAVLRAATIAATMAFVSPLFAPQLLAFPYHATSRGSEVWSEAPLPQPQLDRVTGRAAQLVAASPLARASEPRHIFLTQGGWRWAWLALQNRRSFALSRAMGEPVIVNRGDVATDRLRGVTRSLSGVLAHETCHGMERRHFGAIRSDILAPRWLREGYCDYVAQESTLSAADASRLKAEGRTAPALVYYEGRRRVAAELARNGGNVEALFAAN
ncbi:MAG TPA: hypothetical protein VM055_04920 [Novosphingobium sp.]|nr:hypothetical protein [Novosphingobium sp.]